MFFKKKISFFFPVSSSDLIIYSEVFKSWSEGLL